HRHHDREQEPGEHAHRPRIDARLRLETARILGHPDRVHARRTERLHILIYGRAQTPLPRTGTSRISPVAIDTARSRWLPVSAMSRKPPSTASPPGSRSSLGSPPASVFVVPTSRSMTFTLSLNVSAT